MSDEIKDPQPLVDRIVDALDDACKRGDWAYVRAVIASAESFRRHLSDGIGDVEGLLADRDAARLEIARLEREKEQLAILDIRGAASRHRLEVDRDAALAEVAKLRALVAEMENDDEDDKIYQFVRKDVDAAMRKALGSCWNHMWGPELEELGRYVEAGMLRAETSDARLTKLRAAVDDARGGLSEVAAILGCESRDDHGPGGNGDIVSDVECIRQLLAGTGGER